MKVGFTFKQFTSFCLTIFMCHGTPNVMIIVAEPNFPDCEKVIEYAQEIT